MFQLDARFTALLSVLFIAVGLFNLYIGRKRMFALRKSGLSAIWYKQTSVLTGFEYALLGIVLILNSGISSGFFSNSQAVLVIPAYTVALILAAIIIRLPTIPACHVAPYPERASNKPGSGADSDHI